MDNDGRLSIIRLICGGEIQYKNLCRENNEVKMSLEEALVMVHGRGATQKEDCYVYGVLSIADGCEKFKIAYPRAWEDVLDELGKLGLITERQLATPNVNQIPGHGWLPHCTKSSAYG
jgi:hypothetical protein